MIDQTQRFDLGSKDVAAKVMDGEAVIINLADGVYYSMDKVGAVLWSLIQSGHSLEECIDTVVKQYDAGPDKVAADTERLVQELVQEKLIAPSDRKAADAMDSEAEQAQDLPYETPQLNIYRDMGDLLALDPPTPGLQNSPWGTPDIDEVPS
jgi:hypothetical protein